MSDSDVRKATDELKALAPDYAQLMQDVFSVMFEKVHRSRSATKA